MSAKRCGSAAASWMTTTEKALSWALRELVVHDPRAVEAFLRVHERRLGSRVRREVANKLRTGLKSPRPGSRR